MRVYLDYAATTPLCKEAFEAMAPYLFEQFGNPDSLHSIGRESAYAVTQARDQIASLLGVRPNEVYFTSGGTEADNWAVRGLGEKSGKIYASAIEHHAVLSALSLAQEEGRQTGLLPVAENGVMPVCVPQDASLVCVQAVNNETGCVQPIAEIYQACREKGAILFCDCVQAACTQNLKELAQNCDAFSLSAHKAYGPKGVGVLVVKKGIPLRPLILGGEQERGLRGGTLNVSAIVGFSSALKIACQNRENFVEKAKKLQNVFENYVCSALGTRVRVDGENRAANISHMTFEGGGSSFLNLLDLNGVCASGGAACSAHSALPSHVMRAMGRSEEEAKRGIRFSFGRNTSEEEVLYAAETVVRLLTKK